MNISHNIADNDICVNVLKSIESSKSCSLLIVGVILGNDNKLLNSLTKPLSLILYQTLLIKVLNSEHLLEAIKPQTESL